METLEKLNKEIEKLYKVDDTLFDILEHAGHDSETKYKPAYLDMLDDTEALQRGLHALLDNHKSVIVDIEYELERVPATRPIPKTDMLDIAHKVSGIEWLK